MKATRPWSEIISIRWTHNAVKGFPLDFSKKRVNGTPQGQLHYTDNHHCLNSEFCITKTRICNISDHYKVWVGE